MAKHNWVGILADALYGAMGRPGPYAKRREREMREQSAFERGEERYQRHRMDEGADARALYDYKRLHPDDALTQALDQAGITDPAKRQEYYRQDVERRVAPPMMSAPGVDENGNPVLRFFPRAAPLPNIIPSLPPTAVPIGGAGSGPRTFR